MFLPDYFLPPNAVIYSCLKYPMKSWFYQLFSNETPEAIGQWLQLNAVRERVRYAVLHGCVSIYFHFIFIILTCKEYYKHI